MELLAHREGGSARAGRPGDIHSETLRQEDGEERLEDGAAARRTAVGRSVAATGPAAAADHDLRDDVDTGLLDGLGEASHDLLGQLIARPAVGPNLLLDRDRLGDADPGRALGLGSGQGSDT